MEFYYLITPALACSAGSICIWKMPYLEVNKFKRPIMLKINHIEKNTNDEIGAEEGLLKQWSSNIKEIEAFAFIYGCMPLFNFISVCGCVDVCMHTWVRVPMEFQKVLRSSGAWSQAVFELGAGIWTLVLRKSCSKSSLPLSHLSSPVG